MKDHILRYHGTALEREGTVAYPLMVTESFHCTLKSFIHESGDFRCPASYRPGGTESTQALQSVTEWAWQIACGLKHIHDSRMVHGNLQLWNIVVRRVMNKVDELLRDLAYQRNFLTQKCFVISITGDARQHTSTMSVQGEQWWW